MIFGPSPKVESVPKYIYESTEEGFYNFYIENYKNIYFLPDWLSEFIQVRLNICLDISLLDYIEDDDYMVIIKDNAKIDVDKYNLLAFTIFGYDMLGFVVCLKKEKENGK